MNIFVVDNDPRQAARDLCDKHVVKMVLESAQILSTVVNASRSDVSDLLYKSTHAKHPCTIWAAASADNYQWLVDHADELAKEYTRRFGKTHASAATIILCSALRPKFSAKERTPFALAMPDEFKSSDAVTSYRKYYKEGKKDIAYWRKTRPPAWW